MNFTCTDSKKLKYQLFSCIGLLVLMLNEHAQAASPLVQSIDAAQTISGELIRSKEQARQYEYDQRKLNESREKYKRISEMMCASSEYKEIYSKTPCFPISIDFNHMVDKTFITEEQKQNFIKWRNQLDAIIEERIAEETKIAGVAAENWWNAVYTKGMKPENDSNNVDLFNGKITWGEYNRKRREISIKFTGATK